MIISLLIICAAAFGGLALTYLIADDEPFMWRLAAGNIIGSAIFGLALFLFSMGFGLSPATAGAALLVTLAPVYLLTKQYFGGAFRHDWEKAKGKLQGGNLRRFSGFAYYAFLFVVLWFFFSQAMWQTDKGIFTGGSQNLGDLPFHLGAIFGFTDGNNFPPQNPSFAGAKFTYPFVADLLTAGLMKLGSDVRSAIVLQDVSWAISLVILLESFTARVTGSKLAGRIAPLLLIFGGGLGFVWFINDLGSQSKGIFEVLFDLQRDYTIAHGFKWGNPMVVLFITQRSLLIGMPLTIMVLIYLWRVFTGDAAAGHDTTETATKSEKRKKDKGAHDPAFSLAKYSVAGLELRPFIVGLLAGMLPLIHLHSLATLFVVTACLFAFKWTEWRQWVAFGIGVSVVAIPELAWALTGTASETSNFIGWYLGWDKGDENFFWFWFKNTGFTIPAVIAGIALILWRAKRSGDEDERPAIPPILLFYIPFILLFVISNVMRLAPWQWDNIKVLIYWFVGSVPLIAYVIARLWEMSGVMRFVAGILLAVLIFSGALDVWRAASGQVKIDVFDNDAVRIAEQIKQKTPPDALFLNAPTYNSAVVLSGRRSFMRYNGHLLSHGIDYGPRENITRRIYDGGGVSDLYLRQNGIEYVLVSPIERNDLKARDENFSRYPLIAESGPYKVYKVN